MGYPSAGLGCRGEELSGHYVGKMQWKVTLCN